jgi:hypothetical protein
MTNDPIARRALEDPANWMLWCPECGEEFTLKKLLDADPNWQLSETDLRTFVCPNDLVTRMVLKPTKSNIGDTLFWRKRRKEQNLKDGLETAYLMLKQHAEMAEREDICIDGFAEKRQIIDTVSHYCNLSEKEVEEIYFEAVRQMDKESREKH